MEILSGGDAKKILGLKQAPSLSMKSSALMVNFEPAPLEFSWVGFLERRFVLPDLQCLFGLLLVSLSSEIDSSMTQNQPWQATNHYFTQPTDTHAHLKPYLNPQITITFVMIFISE